MNEKNMNKKQLICIGCPRGCHLTVNLDDMTVVGNSCPKGAEYGVNEVTNPVRTVTSTVSVKGGTHDVIPVRTNGEISKKLIFDAIEVINKISVDAPVKCGDIIIKNILDTGIDVIATRDIGLK